MADLLCVVLAGQGRVASCFRGKKGTPAYPMLTLLLLPERGCE